MGNNVKKATDGMDGKRSVIMAQGAKRYFLSLLFPVCYFVLCLFCLYLR